MVLFEEDISYIPKYDKIGVICYGTWNLGTWNNPRLPYQLQTALITRLLSTQHGAAHEEFVLASILLSMDGGNYLEDHPMCLWLVKGFLSRKKKWDNLLNGDLVTWLRIILQAVGNSGMFMGFDGDDFIHFIRIPPGDQTWLAGNPSWLVRWFSLKPPFGSGIPQLVMFDYQRVTLSLYIYCIYIYCIYVYILYIYIYIMYNIINMDIYIYLMYNIINMDISGYIIKTRVVPQWAKSRQAS